MRVLSSCAILALVASAIPAAAATETVLYSFPSSNLGNPLGPLLLRKGVLYGTASGYDAGGDGQVYALSPSKGLWKFQTLVAFDYPQGSIPRAGLAVDASGALYGSTGTGGVNGHGTVFRLRKAGGSWVRDTVWDFGGTSDDGTDPESDLMVDSKGGIYGTTVFGGTNQEGIVFRFSRHGDTWKEDVIRRFDGNNDGYEAEGGLIMDRKGALYGTTLKGGFGDYGTAYKLTPSGNSWVESKMHDFANTDGALPWAPLVEGTHHTFYGTTIFGGAATIGTVFALKDSRNGWTRTTIHDFRGPDGSQPYGALTAGGPGIFYGTTAFGGDHGDGTVFMLSQSAGAWTETVLYSFAGGGDGINPQGAVTADGKGHLFGTTYYGGTKRSGTVWEITL
ncbi:MAG TPA: choice-of-anchor tandem repeat GloVer-containing protein [Rhizomicrobium sp.]|jgi:uncharacterized repeat protein (TIGR03803 family)